MSSTQPTSADKFANGVTAFFFLNVNFILQMLYFLLLVTGFSAAVGLVFVLIGLPMLSFMFAAARKLAIFDHQFSAGMLGLRPAPIQDTFDPRGRGLLGTLGAYLSSTFTWQSLFYHFIKFLFSIVTFSLIWTLFPIWILEIILNVVGINTGQLIARMIHALAITSQRISDVFLVENAPNMREPYEKPKREFEDDDLFMEKPKRDARYLMDDEPEVAYYIDDEGEIVRRLEKR